MFGVDDDHFLVRVADIVDRTPMAWAGFGEHSSARLNVVTTRAKTEHHDQLRLRRKVGEVSGRTVLDNRFAEISRHKLVQHTPSGSLPALGQVRFSRIKPFNCTADEGTEMKSAASIRDRLIDEVTARCSQQADMMQDLR